MNLIQKLCTWGKGRFDGWVMPRAVYSQYIDEPASDLQVRAVAHGRSLALLEAASFTPNGEMARRLEVTLLSPGYSRMPCSGRTEAEPSPHALCFSQSGLKLFLKEAGDSNPTHQGDPALVPGLWILDSLYQAHPQKHLPGEYRLRLFHPVCTGQSILLERRENSVKGYCHDIKLFHMEIENL